MATPQDFKGIAITAPVTTAYSKSSEHPPSWYVGEVLAQLLSTSGLARRDIDGLSLASYSLAPDLASTMAEHFGLELGWVMDLLMGGSSGVIALRRAARAVQCGDAEVVACVGADALGGSQFKKLIDNFTTFSRDHVNPLGAAGPNGVFALITDHYMRHAGATREDFGTICVAQRKSAMDNPRALLRKPMTMDDYLAARAIATPLHLFDCVLPCCGGEGFLVMSEDRARSRGLPYVTVLGTLETHNAFASDPVQTRGGWEKASAAMYDAAGLGPEDMHFLQAYDDYPVIVMLQMEGLGFCAPRGAPGFVRATPLSVDGGGLPLNTSGGQLSVGQAGAAGGFLGVVEGLRQLTDQPLGRQVPGANVGVVSGYGHVNYDRGICTSAAILQRAGSKR